MRFPQPPAGRTGMKLDKVKEIAQRRIWTEIFLGHNASSMYLSLSEHAERLNQSDSKIVFGLMQRHALDSLILSIGKIYDKPSIKYPNYSIPTAIECIKKEMSKISNQASTKINLIQFIQKHIDPGFNEASKTDLDRVPEIIVNWLDKNCPRTPKRCGSQLDHDLEAVKVMRDKRVAHSEDHDLQGLSTTDLDGPLRLLAFAGTFVNLIGYGFFGSCSECFADPAMFAPDKSEVWPQMQKLLKMVK